MASKTRIGLPCLVRLRLVPTRTHTPVVVSWEIGAFDKLNVLDRAKISGFELKANSFAKVKDMIIKKGHKIECVPPILTTAWSLDQLLLLLAASCRAVALAASLWSKRRSTA